MSKRPRKRHVQQEIVFPKRGGKRPGAGRPKKGFRASEKHETRPALRRTEPVHVIARVDRDVGGLRRRRAYHAFRRALETAFARTDFRVIQISLQRDHVHLVVEADDQRALAKGMQGLQIAAARYLNAAISIERGKLRTGRVFVDRYHARILRTPREVRNVLSYVMNNWRHHHEDRGIDTMFWDVDYFSSGPSFTGWSERPPDLPVGYERLQTSTPESWLLNVGWKRAGSISMRSVPGKACYEG
jgi:REP element-mobilizing transposase RayT